MTRSQATVAASAWGLAAALLLVLPLLADPEVDDVPALGSTAWLLTLVVVTGASAALADPRGRPALVASVVALAVPLAGVGGAAGAIGVTSVAYLVGVYRLAVARPWRSAWSVLLLSGVLLATGQAVAAYDGRAATAVAAGVLQSVVLTGGTLLVGALVVARREARDALLREQDALVRAAVADERTAMARELHDIAAHHLTGIAVLSAAIATQVDTDPEGAKAAVAQVRRESTAVLRDLRRLVGLLREQDGPSAGVRTESLAGIAGLVAQVRASGQRVELHQPATEPRGLGPLAQLTAYRMVQEALANAARHAAGAPCTVEVEDHPGAVTVTVTNGPPRTEPPAPRGGLGLVGMRERAELTGGEVTAGRTPEGGWRVRLVVPRSGADA